MPTVARLDGLRVVIFPNDHGPAHVHVVGAGGEAVFKLCCPGGPPQIRQCRGLSATAVRRLHRSLLPLVPHLCTCWSAIHDHH